mmetsp:Transcript_48425/g.138382  ORF Transcript_48425/g.138382 Transcript_48425/m.138382 type:complete len:282 (-) Transcript_48425:233-1078(-)
MPTQLQGIGEFLKRLEKIAEDCGEKPAKGAEPKDEFLRAKQRMYQLLEEVRDSVHDRQILIKQRGNCYETIQKGNTIRQHLDELNRLYMKLQELHKRGQGKLIGGVRKEEQQARYKDIRVLKKHKDEVHELFLNSNSSIDVSGNSSFGTAGGPQATLFGLRDAARSSEDDSRRLLSADEHEAIAAIRKRDAEVDAQVGELGKVVERLDPLAREIGSAADRQRIKAQAITEEVDNADKDMEALNKKISEVMKYEKNTNCCCQVALLVALLCCVGFVFQQLQM